MGSNTYSVAQAVEQMETNYFGAIRAMQAVLPSMRAAGRGLIINTSSIAARVSVPFFGTYCATKHALEANSQSLRYEVAHFGIDVALVEPGPFPSNLLAAGKPPARTVVGITWGVDEVNAFTQPRQDALPKEMRLDTVLGGADA